MLALKTLRAKYLPCSPYLCRLRLSTEGTGEHYIKKTRSAEIRQTFISYFLKNDHSFVKSSPVLPYNDPTLHFVNAGMNQFKPIFLGNASSSHKRVVNSQKCIRVGGKHNDLDDVGRDGYHHTFFEMLGNWSFGDYFKAEACQMAWELLTKEYGIPPSKLFVSYFKGDELLHLPPDEECFHIWRSLGVPADRILPFGTKENFWEMGLTGPCGPCTEIHYDRSGNPSTAHKLVNADSEDVIEIWNLVFMQYNKLPNGELVRLPEQHVDTGMGLERITSVLAGVRSNYDTDLFQPLLTAISQGAKGVKSYGGTYDDVTDINYRILADHSRMITVALADGMFPDSSHRLRKVLRSALSIARTHFKREGQLLIDLTHRVSEILGEVYPEIPRSLSNVRRIVQFEEDLLLELQSKSGQEWKKVLKKYPSLNQLDCNEYPGLVPALKDLEDVLSGLKFEQLPGNLAFKLYDTYGLSEDAIETVARCFNLSFEVRDFQAVLQNAQMQSKMNSAQLQTWLGANSGTGEDLKQIPRTDTSYRYAYSQHGSSYCFPRVQSQIYGLLRSNQIVTSVKEGERVVVFCDKTNFYSEAGGQCSDIGTLRTPGGEIRITRVEEREGGLVAHVGEVVKGSVELGEEAELEIDSERRLAIMANHTATHLMHSALREVFRLAPQRSSAVSEHYLRFDCALFRAKCVEEDVQRVENLVRRVIKASLPVVRQTSALSDLDFGSVCILPGEVYPDMVNVVRIESDEMNSAELCCGTHVLNTADIEEFAIVSVKSAGTGLKSFKALTRHRAKIAIEMGQNLLSQVKDLKERLQQITAESEGEEKLQKLGALNKKIKEFRRVKEEIPYVTASELHCCITELESALKTTVQQVVNQLVETQMHQAIKNAKDQGFVVAILDIPVEMLICGAKVSLQKAAKCAPQVPLVVLTSQDGCLTAKAVVPIGTTLKEGLTAEKWMTSLTQVVPGKCAAPKGQDPTFVCNFKSARIVNNEMWRWLHRAAERAEQEVRNYVQRV